MIIIRLMLFSAFYYVIRCPYFRLILMQELNHFCKTARVWNILIFSLFLITLSDNPRSVLSWINSEWLCMCIIPNREYWIDPKDEWRVQCFLWPWLCHLPGAGCKWISNPIATPFGNRTALFCSARMYSLKESSFWTAKLLLRAHCDRVASSPKIRLASFPYEPWCCGSWQKG